MPVCTQCGLKRGLDDFSDAQICGRGRCLECSNPRLWAQRLAEGPGGRPLSGLGRTKQPERVEQELRLPAASKAPAASVRCTGCRQLLPASQFSARQLSGKGKCQSCAKQASATNLVQQAEQARKRQRGSEHDAMMEWWQAQGEEEEPGVAADAEEERYVQELLRGVEEARRGGKARTATQSAASAAAAEPVSLDESNAGHALLQRLGWEPGTGLGAQRQGALLPASSHLPGQRDKRGLSQADEVVPAATGDEDADFSRLPAPVAFVSPRPVGPASGE